MKPTTLIVEDHDVLRRSLHDWLSTVFLEARSGEEALELALAWRPDVVLMDIGLPQMSGIEATRRIRAAAPGAQVVMLIIHEAPPYQDAATATGASAYIPKRQMHTELIPVLTRLLSQPADTAATLTITQVAACYSERPKGAKNLGQDSGRCFTPLRFVQHDHCKARRVATWVGLP